MSLPTDNGRSTREGEQDNHGLTDTDIAPRSDGSSTPRFSSCHGQLKFGSCASTFHPPVARSGLSSNSTSSSSLSALNSTATSPKPHEARIATSSTMAASEAIAAPSPATTTDTVMPSSTFSVASTRSPSVSSVSSRASFTNSLLNQKNHISMPSFPIDPSSSSSSAPQALNRAQFNPTLPDPVVETQRRVISPASSPSTTEEDEAEKEQEQMITMPRRIFERYIEQYTEEVAIIRKDRDQLRREVERHTNFHRSLVILCEEKGIRIPPRMYAAFADNASENDNACKESSEYMRVLYG